MFNMKHFDMKLKLHKNEFPHNHEFCIIIGCRKYYKNIFKCILSILQMLQPQMFHLNRDVPKVRKKIE